MLKKYITGIVFVFLISLSEIIYANKSFIFIDEGNSQKASELL